MVPIRESEKNCFNEAEYGKKIAQCRHKVADMLENVWCKMIDTNSLTIHISTDKEMREFISRQTVDVLKEAYEEMLKGALAHPDQWHWYAIWMIELKDGTHIGECCFKGVSSDGVTEIGYGIEESYQGRGYATEAVKAVVNWALQQLGVRRVEAETDDGNIASKHVLEKCGFVNSGEIGEEGTKYVHVSSCL